MLYPSTPANSTGKLLSILQVVREKYISPDEYWELHKKTTTRLRVMTVNLEILKNLLEDPTALHASDACTIDSSVLEGVMNRIFPETFERLTGSEIVQSAPNYTQHRSVMIFGASPTARAVARDRFVKEGTPETAILVADEPTDISERDLEALPPQRVGFFAYGYPKQEQKIEDFTNRFPDAPGILIGVGGAIDYFSDVVKFPPAFIRRHGLEWAWRLFLQPRARFQRIARIVPLAIRLGRFSARMPAGTT